jgi:hypothetical protein
MGGFFRFDGLSMMSNPVSGRIRAVQAPIIPVIAAMIREHPGVISLGQGVAWYGPPQRALERMREFGGCPGQHRYGPVEGLPELRALMADKLERENGISLSGRSVLVTAGANMGFLNALFAIADAGDEIILPSPYYFNQEMAVRMLGCTPVPLPTDGEFQLDLDRLERAITPRTRAIVTISPNNPSGAVYPEAVLRAVNALCRERGLFHITDETYEYFVYDGARHFSLSFRAGVRRAHDFPVFSVQSLRVRQLAHRLHADPAGAGAGGAQGAGHQPDLRAGGLAARGNRSHGNRIGVLPGKTGDDRAGTAHRARCTGRTGGTLPCAGS